MILNLIADDGLFILLVTVSWLTTTFLRNMGAIPSDSILPEFCNELFLLFNMFAVFEGWGKLLTQKPRPGWIKPKDGVYVAGDHFAFPSGHTLRAVAFSRSIFNGPIFRAALGVTASGFSAPAFVVLSIALACGLARLAVGKHTPLDVAGGVLLGLAFGDLFYTHLDPVGRLNVVAASMIWHVIVSFLCVLSFVGFPDWLTGKQFFGFKYTRYQIMAICFPSAGGWVYFMCRSQVDKWMHLTPVWSDTFIAPCVEFTGIAGIFSTAASLVSPTQAAMGAVMLAIPAGAVACGKA